MQKKCLNLMKKEMKNNKKKRKDENQETINKVKSISGRSK